jgi:ParB/RepB/Spo0J family partition protein
MNASTAPTALKAEDFKLLALVELAPSTTRTQERRRARFSDKEIAELADSIRAMGMMLPIIARPHPKPVGPAKYEIVAGERRWLAADKAGQVTAPVIVRAIAEADLVQFQLTENLQRKTIDQLEEAEGYDELRKLKKVSADQVADLLGVSRSTVFNRLKLLDLCPEALQAVREAKIPPSSAMLIARIGHHDTQRKALKDALGNSWNGPLSYRELREQIQRQYMVELKNLPFKLEDATLTKAGSCIACTKRTGNNKDLFADVKNPNTCTDPKCLEDKIRAHGDRARKEYEVKGGKVITGPAAKEVFSSTYDRDHVGGGFNALDATIWDDPKHRKAGQIVEKEAIELVQHPTTGIVHQVVRTSAITEALNAKGVKTQAQKIAQERAKRAKKRVAKDGPDDLQVDELYEDRLFTAVHAKNVGPLSTDDLRRIAAFILCRMDILVDVVAKAWNLKTGYLDQKDALRIVEKYSPAQLGQLLREAIVNDSLDVGNLTELEALAKRFKIDPKKIRKDIVAELKTKTANNQMKAKLAKASPLVKTAAKKNRKSKRK